ncbi:uncharacterized protein LOC142488855 [Ascaphus truei]|uniref:uncharacterized protein LOC142488855 n=1 Tax=Ascaphus truei TaxID=8439 RepID=UPI003F594CCD
MAGVSSPDPRCNGQWRNRRRAGRRGSQAIQNQDRRQTAKWSIKPWQAQQIRAILMKNWGVLKLDKDLDKYTKTYPRMVFRRAKTIGNKISPSLFEPKKDLNMLTTKGFFSCGNCRLCSPLEELLRAKLLPVVVEGLPGDRDIGIYPSQFPPVAPEGHVSPETEQVSSPGSASSTHLEEHDEEDYDDDDDDDAAAAIDTQIQASDHEEVPIETVLPPNRPANTTYDAIVASEGKIVEAENRRHSDLMTVLERMIALQEETVSQLAHLHRVFIEVPKQLQKINTSFEALVVQQTQANYLRMTNVPQFNLNTSQAGSVHAGQFSPHASDIHSPGPNVTGQVADIAVQVPDDILPLPSVQIQQLTPTKEATKRKHKQLLLTSFWSKTTKDTHETDQPSLVQCLPTCSHVSVGTSPVGESLATSPVGESLPKSPVSESLPKSPVSESLPKSPVDFTL